MSSINSLPTFKSVDAYQSYVRGSEVTKLPEAKARVSQDQLQLSGAQAALAARKRETNYDALQGAVSDAESKLDVANHPMRAQAAQLRAQASSDSDQSAQLEGQIVRLQSDITNIQANRAASLNSNTGLNDGSLGGALADLAVSGAAYAAGSAGIHNAQKQIQGLVQQKARLDADAMVKTTTAATLDVQPGDPEVVKPFKDAVTGARAKFAEAVTATQPQADAVNAAQGKLSGDSAEAGRLESLKTNLQDYDARFSVTTRTSLWWGDHSWKQKLNDFWGQLK